MPWDDILSFCEWVVGLSDDIKLTIEGDEFDDDSDYQNLKSQVLNLLDSGLAVRPTTDNPGIGEKNIPRVQTLLANYVDNPDPTPEHEAQYGGDNMDPLTLSLNTVRPVAIRALIKLVYGFPDNPAAVEALAILDKHVAGRDPSLAVTAAIGEGTGRLYDSARPWIEERAGAIFGEHLPTTEYQQVALSTTLAVYSFHSSLFELLRGSILLMIKEMPDVEHVSGWSDYRRTFDQLIGDWIMLGIIHGHFDYNDEIVELWFSRAEADLRGNVQGNLARLMTGNSEIPDNILERMADLWNRRIVHVKEHPEDAVELKGIYWLVDSGRYEVEWWLPRLEYVSSVVPGFQTHGMLSDKLVEASLVDPDTSLKVVENLILRNIGSGSFHFEEYDLINNAVPKIIANALNTKKPDIEQRATYLMNQLGIAGYTDLKKRVEKLRESEKKND